MPSKSKKQLNLFKITKSYLDNGLDGLFKTWVEIYPKRKVTQKEIENIKKIANNISYADLEDLSSGIEGDEVLGDNLDIKVGYWIKFESEYINADGDKKKNIFITKIKRITPDINLINFNHQDLYNRNGVKINPIKRVNILNSENMWLDFAYFNQIKETSKTKDGLIIKNEIRKIVRKVLNESITKDIGGLKIKKINSNEEVSVKTKMLVQKKSDETKGQILNVGIDFSVVPPKNNLNILWIHGDLAGTKQTVDLDDVEAI